MANINLIPDIKQERLKARKRRKLVFGSAVVAALIGIGVPATLGVLLIAQNGLIDSTQDDIDAAIVTLEENEELPEVLTVQNNLEQLPALSDEGFSLRLLLDEVMPRVITNRIAVENIEFFYDEGSLNLTGEARSVSDVYTMAELMRNIEITNTPTGQEDQEDTDEDQEEESSHIFSEVSVIFIDPDTAQVSFSIETSIDTSLFNRDLYAPEIEPVTQSNNEEFSEEESNEE